MDEEPAGCMEILEEFYREHVTGDLAKLAYQGVGRGELGFRVYLPSTPIAATVRIICADRELPLLTVDLPGLLDVFARLGDEELVTFLERFLGGLAGVRRFRLLTGPGGMPYIEYDPCPGDMEEAPEGPEAVGALVTIAMGIIGWIDSAYRALRSGEDPGELKLDLEEGEE